MAAIALAAASAAGPDALVASSRGAEARLPDLVQEVPQDLQVDRVRTRRGARRFHLGFRSAVNNAGTGPLIIRSRRGSRRARLMRSHQVVTYDDGTTRTSRQIGWLRFVNSSDHRHWHFFPFERYQLRSADGRRSLRRDRKTGFCLGDRYSVDFWTRGPFEPELPVYTHNCAEGESGRLSLEEGISVGYGDDYPAHLEGQYVDVTGVPAGRYLVVHRVNAARRIAESNYANNASSVLISLTWPNGTGEAPQVSVLRSCPETADCPLARR